MYFSEFKIGIPLEPVSGAIDKHALFLLSMNRLNQTETVVFSLPSGIFYCRNAFLQFCNNSGNYTVTLIKHIDKKAS